jgi:cytochrome c5
VAQQQNSDTHFFNSFMEVLGILVTIAIVLFALARVVAARTQEVQVQKESLHLQHVVANIEPFSHVAVAGQDNTALAALDKPSGDAPAADVPKDGTEAFQKLCSTCHTAGIAGAPKIGDHAAWGPRVAQGKNTLYEHAIKGFKGKTGVMVARGGSNWPDDIIRQAVDHMLELNK